jgi:hypothetical protein
MWGLRISMPKRSMWRVAQFDTLRLRLIKIAVFSRLELGDLSGAASPHTRTPPDFGMMAKTSDELCAKYGLLINDDFRRIISQRRRHLMATHRANLAREFRRSKRFDRYINQVLRNPDFAPC